MKKETFYSRLGSQTVTKDSEGRTIVDDNTGVPTTAPPLRPRLDLGDSLIALLLSNSIRQGALFRGIPIIGEA